MNILFHKTTQSLDYGPNLKDSKCHVIVRCYELDAVKRGLIKGTGEPDSTIHVPLGCIHRIASGPLYSSEIIETKIYPNKLQPYAHLRFLTKAPIMEDIQKAITLDVDLNIDGAAVTIEV